uniref:Fucoidan deacetylase n=1 Tax=Luteolibacter algae TaxID=454151 RepID=A0A2Z5X923_9BACT|nr:fucoidan deacetylase [Luteolibacter algae]
MKILKIPRRSLCALLPFASLCLVQAQDTLPPLEGKAAPQTYDELWDGYDPRAEPLDVEVLKEWEQDGVVMKVLRYRIGMFKGQKSMMAAVYGYPKGAEKLPGLVQIHGGGQYADANAVLTNAKRGYATISVSWAGRINAPDYKVNPDVVKLFWEGETEDPAYKVITDWGAVDGYHAPSRSPGNQFPKLPKPSEWTIDPVVSPRSNGWFLCTLGMRRALTFLEQQPEVDADKLGVYGHSMGGKLTVLTAGSDPRVKAAAPSCGGISDRDNEDPLFNATLGDAVYLEHITAPTIFLSPANDFHGRIDDLQLAVREIQTDQWRVTCSPHHSHQDTAEYEVATQLWFDQILKGSFEIPATPETKLELARENGVPVFSVKPDASREILALEIYYTQQGQVDGKMDDRENTKARFWHFAKATKNGDAWTGELPLHSVEKPLWVYANVLYALDEPVSGAGYYYRDYTTDRFNVSSLMSMVSAAELAVAGVKPTMEKSLLIESFGEDWKRGWFSYFPEEWPIATHKVYDPVWKAPAGATLSLEVLSAEPNKMAIGLDGHFTEIEIAGGSEWQAVSLSPADFESESGEKLGTWEGIRELQLEDGKTLSDKKSGEKKTFGGKWQGAPPQFRNLRWIAK